MLEGTDFSCNYCEEQMALPDRFYVLAADEGTGNTFCKKGSFCCPECASAANEYLSSNVGSDVCANRHRLLEQEFQRRIKSAPPRKMLYHYNKRTGLRRSQWMPMCRNDLSKSEMEMVKRELELPLAEPEKIVHPIKKC